MATYPVEFHRRLEQLMDMIAAIVGALDEHELFQSSGTRVGSMQISELSDRTLTRLVMR
jgi:hypothetical protein